MRGICYSLDSAFTPVRSNPARGCACLNGANAGSIRHHVDYAHPECLANSP